MGSNVIKNKLINKYVFGLSITEVVLKQILLQIGIHHKLIVFILLFL
jgi:hypothetical protein